MENKKLAQTPELRLKHPREYSKKNVYKIVRLYLIFLQKIYDKDTKLLRETFLNTKKKLNIIYSEDGWLKQENILFVHDMLFHILSGLNTDQVSDSVYFHNKSYKLLSQSIYSKSLYGELNFSYFASLFNQKLHEYTNIEFENIDLTENFYSINKGNKGFNFQEFYKELDNTIKLRFDESTLKNAYDLFNLFNEQKHNEYLSFVSEMKNENSTLNKDWLKQIGRQQYLFFRIQDQMMNIMAIALPKMLEYEDYNWESIYKDPDIQNYLDNNAKINEQFNNPQYDYLFDSESHQANSFWEEFHAKADQFNKELKRFLSLLSFDKEIYLIINRRNGL